MENTGYPSGRHQGSPGTPNSYFTSSVGKVYPSDGPQPLSQSRKKVSFNNQPSTPTLQPGENDAVLPSKPTNDSGNSVFSVPSPRTKRKHRPKHFYESPRVYIRAEFMKIGEIDTVKEMYTSDVFIQARWREPALDSMAHKKSKINWSDYWNPSLAIENLVENDNDRIWRDVTMTSSGEAFVLERRRIRGKFGENMELQSFPFDTQHLSMVVTSEQKEVELVEETMEPCLIHHATFIDEQEWHMHDLVECVPSARIGASRSLLPSSSELVIRIHATRRNAFFLWNINTIMILICSLALCTFSVERDHPSNRLQLSFTLMLTAVAFKFAANQSLPKIPYQTILDKYILTSMILMHVVCIWHACICLVPSSSEIGDTLDIIAFVVFAIVFLLYQFIFAVVVNAKIRVKRALLQQLELNYQEKVNKVMGEGFVQKKREVDRKRKENHGNPLSEHTMGFLFQ